jgi:hypothetical protein
MNSNADGATSRYASDNPWRAMLPMSGGTLIHCTAAAIDRASNIERREF